nr:hypothetical protein [Bacteroidota bacterium]
MKNNHTKFVIFGQGRSGSNLLVDLLNNHPEIVCYKELFNVNKWVNKTTIVRRVVYKFPHAYINYIRHKNKHRIFGFKLMYHQMLPFEKQIQRMFQQDWKVIHMHRNDLLKQSLSGLIAHHSGVWIHTAGRYHEEKVYRIDPLQVIEDLVRRTNAAEYEKIALTGIGALTIVYEDHLEDPDKWQNTAKQVFEFLDTYPVEVTTRMVKSDSRTLKERIENYDEIIDQLKATKFASLLPADETA